MSIFEKAATAKKYSDVRRVGTRFVMELAFCRIGAKRKLRKTGTEIDLLSRVYLITIKIYFFNFNMTSNILPLCFYCKNSFSMFFFLFSLRSLVVNSGIFFIFKQAA